MTESSVHLPVRSPRRVVVIGASAGGVPALTRLMSGLDPHLDAAVLVVLHLPPKAYSVLPDILSRAGTLPAAHPRDREPMVAGQVYVAPPDRHLLVHDDTLCLSTGPWENGHRPSVDALFRSAARWHGSAVVAVVLTGALDDGAAGVAAVAERGGVVLVQDPGEADVADMPRKAIEAVPDATIAPLDDLARRINALARTEPPPQPTHLRSVLADEVSVAEGEHIGPEARGETPAGLVCPDCSGSLFEAADQNVLRFRCRVGHAWTAEALATANGRRIEEALWVALRVLEEDEALRARLSSQARARGRVHTARRYEQQTAERQPVIELIRRAIDGFAGEAAAARHEADSLDA